MVKVKDKQTLELGRRIYDAKYDITKFVLSLFVLAIHSNLYPMVLYPWLRIAVPLFFIITSYFVFKNLSNATEAQQKSLITKFVVRNLKLYLCWFIILLPITLYIRRASYFSGNIFVNLLNFLRSAVFGSTFVASWYIMASIIGVLIIFYLRKWLKNNYFVLFVCLLAFVLVTLYSSYSTWISGTLIARVLNIYKSIAGSFVCSFPASLIWVFVGKCFAEHKCRSFPIWVLVA